jgi:hypothetical protein
MSKVSHPLQYKHLSIYRTDPGLGAGFVFWSGAYLLFPMRSSGALTLVRAPREASPIRNSVVINSSLASPLGFGPRLHFLHCYVI